MNTRSCLEGHNETAEDKPKGGSDIRSVIRTFAVLRALAGSKSACRLTDLAKATGSSPSLLRAYLRTLQRVGMVRQDPSTGMYDLGLAAVDLGMAALRRLDLMTLARPVLNELCEKVKEPILLSIWSESGPVVVHHVTRYRSLPYEIRIGSRTYATTTAAGRCFLVHIDSTERDELIAAERAELGADALPQHELERLLDEARETGLATRSSLVFLQEDVAPAQVHALAAPVFDSNGRIVAAITMLSKNAELSKSTEGYPGRALLATAAGLSRELGFRPSIEKAEEAKQFDYFYS